ncbi:MAG: hypothetical protein MHM6MM_002041 [Cercozoa sp. M6MM]
MTELLARVPGILEQLQMYESKQDVVRAAMSKPNEANEQKAFVEVTQNAEIIAGFWRFSKELEQLVPKAFQVVAGISKNGQAPLVADAAFSRKLCEVLDFILKFDTEKLKKPGLQNDFAFYRRALNKHAHDPDLVVRDDDASFISLFLAAHIPMMTCVSKACKNVFKDDEALTQSIATFANSCLMLARHKKFPVESPLNMLAIRAMTGAIVLYDHVEPEGAFLKRSPVFMRPAAVLLTRDFPRDFPGQQNDIDPLVNALRFSSMHFNDESTPDAITALLT